LLFLSILGGAKTAIEESVSQDGAFPVAAQDLIDLGIKTSSKYVATVVPADLGGGLGTLTATFEAAGVSADLQGTTVVMERRNGGDWECNGAQGGTAGTVDAKFLPKVCRP